MSATQLAVDPTAYLFVFIALAGGLLAVSLRNILHAIFGLALSLLGIAALFFYLGSPFVGAMQVVIYVGGISVAMVFAVMFSYTVRSRESASLTRYVVGGAGALVFFGAVGAVLWRTDFGGSAAVRGDWSVEAIGRALLQHYNLVFEALSVVLLLAIVGAIVIARRESDS